MTLVVSNRTFTAETPVRSRVWAHEIGGGQMNTRAEFSPSNSVSPLLLSFHLCSTFFFHLGKYFVRKTSRRRMETFDQIKAVSDVWVPEAEKLGNCDWKRVLKG
jgi:hypothetical protein